MKKWIKETGIKECGEEFKKTFKKLKFPEKGKPTGHLYIDDRGFHFDGKFPSMEFVESFKPWNKE